MKKSTKQAVGVGAGIATVAVMAAAAAAYLLSGDKGKARRKKAKAWIVDARKEIAKDVKFAKRLGKPEYSQIVDRVLKKYRSLDDVNVRDVMETGRELKDAWKKIQQQAGTVSKTKKSSTRKKRASRRTTRTSTHQ